MYEFLVGITNDFINLTRTSARRIYLASSWRNPYQPALLDHLRRAGHQVYDFRNPSSEDHGFSWSEVDPDWKNWTPEQYRAALDHPIARAGFARDHTAMDWADTCVLLLPSGRSAHVEAGWMAGQGKPVHVVCSPGTSPEAELMYREFLDVGGEIHADTPSLIAALDHPIQSPRETLMDRIEDALRRARDLTGEEGLEYLRTEIETILNGDHP
jgi:nucleoside 2-deoxyribosyltransferase